MEGISKVIYKNKTIFYIDYSGVEITKEKAVQILKSATELYKNLSFNSVLALVNLTNLRCDMDLLTTFRDEGKKTAPYEKKVAVIGINNVQKAAYNFISGFSNNKNESF